jgi:hypothetical protein
MATTGARMVSRLQHAVGARLGQAEHLMKDVYGTLYNSQSVLWMCMYSAMPQDLPYYGHMSRRLG